MGKIFASYLAKVHLHDADDAEPTDPGDAPTNEDVKQAIQNALVGLTSGGEVTVSLIERTDD